MVGIIWTKNFCFRKVLRFNFSMFVGLYNIKPLIKKNKGILNRIKKSFNP